MIFLGTQYPRISNDMSILDQVMIKMFNIRNIRVTIMCFSCLSAKGAKIFSSRWQKYDILFGGSNQNNDCDNHITHY